MLRRDADFEDLDAALCGRYPCGSCEGMIAPRLAPNASKSLFWADSGPASAERAAELEAIRLILLA